MATKLQKQLRDDAAKAVLASVKKTLSTEELEAYPELIAAYCNELSAYQALSKTFDPTDYKQMMASKMQFEKVVKLATALSLTPKARGKKATKVAIELPE